ncbi:MAG TPA: cupredoxin domain-containing protein [Methylomirabilota bacterium]|jgi:plastocyanin
MRRLAAGLILVAIAGALLAPQPALSADPPEIPLTIEKAQFQPAEVRVKSGTPFVLVITNKDAAAAEFESKELRVEKVVPAGKTVKVRIRALKPGSYPFFNEFHQQTTGKIVAE